MAHALSHGVHVRSGNGNVYVHVPQMGQKIIRVFTPLGSLLQEYVMAGSEQIIDNIRHVGKLNLILTVTQGRKTLFKGVLRMK